jgi:hypothetical protein
MRHQKEGIHTDYVLGSSLCITFPVQLGEINNCHQNQYQILGNPQRGTQIIMRSLIFGWLKKYLEVYVKDESSMAPMQNNGITALYHRKCLKPIAAASKIDRITG